ncbi:ATP-dependent DNA helicase Q4-like [Ylistrum balloti]|uniref:ATP-dependent DNA helicase Q4-like n=1 Tax=Ylistrum balloti TaxID=509963 RepID=UPI0029059A3F|nr:ATP-dependent DNA helicase Q4-like [Ylistrum balloti]
MNRRCYQYAYLQYNKHRKEEKRKKSSSDCKFTDIENETVTLNSTKRSTLVKDECALDNIVTSENKTSNYEDDEECEGMSADTHLENKGTDKTSEQPEIWGRQFDKKLSSCSVEKKPKNKPKKNNVYLKGLSSKLFANSKKFGEKEAKEQAILTRQWKQSIHPNVAKDTPPAEQEESFTCFSDETDTTDPVQETDPTENKNMESSKFGMFRKAVSVSSQKTCIVPKPDIEDVIVYSKYSTTCKVRSEIPVLPRSVKDKYDFRESKNDEIDGIAGSEKSEFSENVTTLQRSAPKQPRCRKLKKTSCQKDVEQLHSSELCNDSMESNVGSQALSNCGDQEMEVVPVVPMKKTYQKWTGETVTPDCIPVDLGEDKMEVEDIPVISKQDRKRKKDKCEEGAPRKRKKAEIDENTCGTSLVTGDTENQPGGGDSIPAKKQSSAGGGRKLTQDNFVRLNMKVKTYKRKGGKGMTGPQHKRFMWKQKMAARSASRGDNCFKCGQPGHWASKCPGGSSKSGKMEGGDRHEEPINEEDFPSLHEAAMMAKGIKRSEDKTGKKMMTQHDKKGVSLCTAEDDNEDIQIEAGITRSAPEDIGAPPPFSPLIKSSTQAQEEHTNMYGHFASNTVTSQKLESTICHFKPVYLLLTIVVGKSAKKVIVTVNGSWIKFSETPEDVWKGLKMFGFDGFRRGQEKAVMRILSGQSTLVVLSTGGGKSLCYQLPAYLYAQKSKSITLVISPLVSLMEDQITGLPAGLHGACLHTNMTPAKREGVLASVKDGHVHFLLVSPEAVAGGNMSLLNSRANLPPISFVCIDEAHCLSEWSHNFRPAYLRLCKVLRDKFGVRCFLGLTATATQSTAADVAKHIGIEDCDEAVIRGPPVPRNLFLSVSRDEDRDQSLIGMLQGKRFSQCESIIIYCTRRDQTERLATLIRTCLQEEKSQDWEEGLGKKKGGRKKYAFWDAESYHAGLTAAQRKRVQNAFMSGRLRVVVATVAFGMGLDKSNVRGIIHYNLPKSFESYVQEIGRAGRDGRESHCHLFLDSEGKDLCELRRHTYANTVDYRTIKKFLQHIFVPCHCKAVQKLQQQAQKEKDECEKAAQLCATDWDEEDMPTPGVDTSTPLPGGDIGTSTPGGDTSTLLPEGNTGTPTPGGATGTQTPEGDTITTTPGGATGTQTPRGDTGTPTPGGDTGTQTPDGDTITTTPGGATGTPTPGGDTGTQTPRGDTGMPTQPRVCVGHERAMPIDDTVMSLDVKEEGLCTLMCYLENHSQMWLQSMSNVYANCHIQCYGGPSQLQKLAKKCPPIAVAIAKAKKNGKSFRDTNSLSFSVVEISDSMGWASAPVKQELKTLAWDFNKPAGPVKSGVLVEFSNLAFHFRSPGDLDDDELDDVLQFLHNRVQTQEKTELQQLRYLYNTLRSVSHKNYWMCSDEYDKRKDEKLKVAIVDYFQQQTLLKQALQEADNTPETPQHELRQLVSDIRQFVNVYGTDHKLNGRAVARVFHGIGSPCFPANVWGRNRRYWRAYMNIDFNLVVRTATKELISMR